LYNFGYYVTGLATTCLGEQQLGIPETGQMLKL
jgi:hypothetical protein